MENDIVNLYFMCLPADSNAEGTARCSPQQATHQIDTVGWGE